MALKYSLRKTQTDQAAQKSFAHLNRLPTTKMEGRPEIKESTPHRYRQLENQKSPKQVLQE